MDYFLSLEKDLEIHRDTMNGNTVKGFMTRNTLVAQV